MKIELKTDDEFIALCTALAIAKAIVDENPILRVASVNLMHNYKHGLLQKLLRELIKQLEPDIDRIKLTGCDCPKCRASQN